MGDVKRFIPKDEQIARAKAEEFRQYVMAFDGLSGSLRDEVLIGIARHENGGKLMEWRFVMLSPAQCLAVWDAIRALPSEDRPQQVRHLFDLVITHIEVNTGLVTLTREELAELIGTAPANVSRMMGTLEGLGVINRERKKVAGMRGAGVARYRVNSHVAWNGKLEIRAEKAKQEKLPFGVIEGGKS